MATARNPVDLAQNSGVLIKQPAQSDSCRNCLPTLLLREGNHRIANSLQTASSTLLLQARKTTSGEARAVLNAVAQEIHSVSLLHRRLSQRDQCDIVDLSTHIRELCYETGISLYGRDGADITFMADVQRPVFVDGETANQFGIVLIELLSNSMKHAAVRPSCVVRLAVNPGNLELSVRDNGPGLPDNFRLEAGRAGIGLQVLRRLLDRLGGAIAVVPSASGAHFVVTVPMAA